MRTKMMAVLAALAALQASLATAGYVTFMGETSNSNAPTGSLSLDANWLGGALPSGSSTGLVSTTATVWTGNAWNNLAVRQTGGFVNGGTAVNLRGGLSGSGITTIYEIDDSRTNYGSYTNLATTGALTLWSQHGEKIELSLLSGRVEADSLSLNAAGKGTIRVKDGVLHARLLNQASGSLKFLSGGSGTVSFDEMTAGIFANFYVDFASDSSGSLHIGEVAGGGNTKASIEWLVNNGRVSIDGTTSTDWANYKLDIDGTASTLSLNPYADYVVFIGQNNNPSAPSGALNLTNNWAGGTLPSGSSTGLVSTTVNVWSGTAWYDLAVKQVGGYVYATGGGDFALRGGTSGSGITTVYEIDDARTAYETYTNLYVAGTFTLWPQYGEKMELSLLSGRIEAGRLSLVAAGKGTVNVRDGLLRAGKLGNNAAGRVNMLAGGEGRIVVDDMDGLSVANLFLNFETGNQGSFTLGAASNGVSAAGTWEGLVNSGHVLVDGAADTRAYKYSITQDGLASTIALAGATTPTEAYAAWASGYGLTDPGGTGAMEADPDGDGRSNLAEYAMGGNPVDNDDPGYVPGSRQVAAGGTNWIEHVHFERADKEDLGLDYRLERGPNLIYPDWMDSQIEFVGSGPFDADFDAVTNRISTDLGGSHFIRLRVELQE